MGGYLVSIPSAFFSLYKMIGREGCYVLDCANNIGGSETIAETFFNELRYQKKYNQIWHIEKSQNVSAPLDIA